MLSKYDSCTDIKKEIHTYMQMLNTYKNLKNEQNLTGIVKRILFLKTLFLNGQSNHYNKFMIYDILILMHCLTQNSRRNFYNIYRSFIENFIRVILELPDNDNTGVRNLFAKLRTQYGNSEQAIEFINFIEGEYGKCCEYVHSNINAGLSVLEYYDDIIKTDEMNNKQICRLIKNILKLVQEITLFIIYISPEFIDSAFYRKKQELKYLIGESNYIIFRQNLE